MSFGFSAGDFIAAALLVKDVIAALRSSSASEYRELLLELHGLQIALREIEHLEAPPGQESKVNAVKAAALLCRYPLSEFNVKLKRYQSLDTASQTEKDGRLKTWRLKLQWGFCMEEEVQKLRAYLAAHVCSLNMRLATLNLDATRLLTQQISANNASSTNCNQSEDSEHSILAQDQVSEGNTPSSRRRDWASTLSGLLKGCLMPQLELILNLVDKVWNMNLQIIDMLANIQALTVPPNTQYTFFQQPVKIEDGLGRVLWVPSEYDWGMLDALVRSTFRSGPGHVKVASDEYEFYDALDLQAPLPFSEGDRLIPGMNIIMAFIIGLYQNNPIEHCPRPGCQARDITINVRGGKKCSRCELWFHVAQTTIPRPFRKAYDEEDFRNLRSDRKWFKNVQVHPFDLAQLVLAPGKFSLPPERVHVSCITAPQPPRPKPSLAFCSGFVIDEEDARRGILQTAEYSGFTVEEICDNFERGLGLECLGFDSIMFVGLYASLRSLGISLPPPIHNEEDPSGMTFFDWLSALVGAFAGKYQATSLRNRARRHDTAT